MLSILQAIWQADGAFPSGSFAFSYGIEGVVALRPELDQAGLAELAATIVRQRWLTCDRIALVKAFRCAGDLDAIADIDRNVEASTFGSTMRDGSRRNGGSFLASHARLGDVMALRLRGAVRSGICLGHIAVMQGAVWQTMGLSEMLAQLASAYGVASGVEGQKILRGCLPLIETLVAQPVPEDAELSSFVPFLEIAAARHARADLRLFAN
jgi:urease accessory protein